MTLVLVGCGGSAPHAASAPSSALPDAYRRASAARLEHSIDLARAIGGYQGMSPLAYTLLRAGDQVAWDDEKAWRLARHAAPDEPRLYWTRFLDAVRQYRAGTALGALGGALLTTVSDPWTQLHLLSLLSATLNAGCWFAIFAVVALTAVSRGTLLLHDYSDSFPRRFRRVAPVCFAVLLIATLWTAGVGLAVLLVVCGLMLTPYMETRGKVSFGVLVALGCMTPLVLSGLGRGTTGAANGAWNLYRVWRGDNGADLMADLEATLQSDRRFYVLARVARRNGDLEQAARLLEKAPASLPGGLVATEQGNLEFLAGKYDAALSFYQQAAARRPDDAVPFINQHVVHLELLQLDRADEALAQARATDAEAAERLEAQLGSQQGRLLPVSHQIPERWIVEEYFSRQASAPVWTERLQQAAFFTSDHLRPEFLGAFALLLAVMAHRAGSDRRSRYCPSCGFVVCPRCSRRVKGSLLCSACWTVDRDRDVDAAEKERRDVHAARWARRARRLKRFGHLALPGWTGFWFEARWGGLAWGCFWAFSAGLLLITFLYPVPLWPWGGQLRWTSAAVFLALAHLYGIRCAVRVA